ncbi:MAG: DNA repair protein RadC [Verrucomicrobiota bacterium]
MKVARIRDLPEQEQPREKLAARGPHALGDAELLAILLRTGTVQRDVVALSRFLLSEFGGLDGIARAEFQELANVSGLGRAKVCQLKAALELAVRLARERLREEPLNHPKAVYRYLGLELQQLPVESLRVILLDVRLCPQRAIEITRGSVNESIAHPREILRPVIAHSGYGFVLVHNHPSGDPTPSQADRAVTKRVAEAAELMQVRFLDHLIIGLPSPGREPYYSFQEEGLL